MKRILAAILILALTAGLLSGCQLVRKDPGKPTIVVTIFPIYDWVRNVLGDQAENYELVLLMQNGSDLHSFTPGLADMQKIRNADLFIYVGGESDNWVPGALNGKKNNDMIILNLMDRMGSALREEEYVEGMVHEAHDDDEGETAYDEHIWLSLRNAQLAVSAIREAMSELDAKNADLYQKNADAYLAELDALDQRYRDSLSAAPLHTLIFADRFPFRYLTEDYNLDYYAAYPGCSSEIGTSITTVPFLAGKVDELGAAYLLCLENGGSELPEKVASQASRSVEILSVNSMQFITRGDIDGGATYLGIMEHNLEALTKALGAE